MSTNRINNVAKQVPELPAYCYQFLPSELMAMEAGRLKVIRPIIIRRGHAGYWRTNWDWTTNENGRFAKEALAKVNRDRGVTEEQAETMMVYSMFGWPRGIVLAAATEHGGQAAGN